MKLLLALMFLIVSPVMAEENFYSVLQSSVSASSGSGRAEVTASKISFQATGRTTAGAGAATVVLYGSNDGVNYLTLGTITLTLSTAETSDGFTSDNAWRLYRSSVTAISGTGALASAFLAGKN